MTGDTYQSSGVNLEVMENLKDRIKAFASMTHGPEVLGSGGRFCRPLSAFRLSGAGAGRQRRRGRHQAEKSPPNWAITSPSARIWLPSTSNDILTRGAKPLFFLDYIAFTTLDEQRMETLVRGIAWGCREVGCALIGGGNGSNARPLCRR